MANEPDLLEVKNLKKHFPVTKGLLLMKTQTCLLYTSDAADE